MWRIKNILVSVNIQEKRFQGRIYCVEYIIPTVDDKWTF